MQNYNFVKNDVFVAKICKYALYESSEGLFCAPRKAANFCHPGCNSCSCWFHIDLIFPRICLKYQVDAIHVGKLGVRFR